MSRLVGLLTGDREKKKMRTGKGDLSLLVRTVFHRRQRIEDEPIHWLCISEDREKRNEPAIGHNL